MPISFFFFFLLHLRFIVVDVVLYFTLYLKWIKRKDRIIFGLKKPGENNKKKTIYIEED